MSRRGNCWDNAVAESFYSSLKKNVSGREYTKPGTGPGGYFDYIEVFYNRNRRHSHLGSVSPEAFEQASS
jgi:putative transposase